MYRHRFSAIVSLCPVLACCCVLHAAGAEAFAGTGHWNTVLIVLGNEPLDDSTPTVDTVARVKKAVAYQKEHPGTLLLFTGGPTAGQTSEARMMANLAIAQGVASNAMMLEERARSTQENAELTAETIAALAPVRVMLVSKPDHLVWAVRVFQKHDVFKSADLLPSEIPKKEIIALMQDYLKAHPDNKRVRKRLLALLKDERGTD